MMLEGGCLCGAVRYRVSGDLVASGICHCETCRRSASAPTLPFVTVARNDFALVQGRPAAFRSSPHVVRRFCGTCGSGLTYENERDPDVLDVMTCSLDAPDAAAPTFTVWISEKIAWDVSAPGIPAYPRSRSEVPLA